MNIILGSAGGIGQSLYKLYRNRDLEVTGIDKVESDTTDYVYDFAKLEKTKELINYFSDCKISSITYCIAEH